MRKTILSFIAMCVAAEVSAQLPGDAAGITASNMAERIAQITTQIDSVKEDIRRVYDDYSNQKFFTDETANQAAFPGLENEIGKLRAQVMDLNHEVDSLAGEYLPVEKLKEYYAGGNIDSLYVHSDPLTLEIHRKVLGPDSPPVIDNLLILFECSGVVDKEYDRAQNSSALKKLEKVEPCAAKDRLEDMLLIQNDMTEEVKSWLEGKDHSLYSAMKFREYVYDNYGRWLDMDFPYLNRRVVEGIELNSND